MELVFHTNLTGYFQYKVYRETPDNIIYESPVHKNLILDSGLSHLYTKSVPESIKVLDFGVSNTPPDTSQTSIVSGKFTNSVLFTDLSALSSTSEIDYANAKSNFRSFFRTPTTLRPLQLREFAVKPDAFENAFARQLLNIDLSGGDGIEFSYNVEVEWPCGINEDTIDLEYRVGNEFNEYDTTLGTYPTTWTASSGTDNLNWSSIVGNSATLVAAASTLTTGNIIYSTDSGTTWGTVSAATGDLSANKFSSTAYGYDSVYETNRYVSVGTGKVAYSDTSIGTWKLVDPYATNNWTGITYGNIIESPYTSYFLAVADDGDIRMMKSRTGADWLSAGDSFISKTPRWSSITYGPSGGFVAVALSGINESLSGYNQNMQIAYSTDATNWLSAASPEVNEWESIAYGFNRYVAVASTGTNRVMYADETDLTTWYSSEMPADRPWYDVKYGNGVFVAVASGGAAWSVNGIDWFNVVSIESRVWKSVAFAQTVNDLAESTNSFTAIAANAIDTNFIGTATYVPPIYPTASIPLSTSLVQIPLSGHVYSGSDNILYTLSGLDLRNQCLSTPYLEHVNYSTGSESSSYAEASTTLSYPNSACSTYTFNHLSGYGPIKGGIITTGRIKPRTFTIVDSDGETFTDILTGTDNGIYAFTWAMPRVLQATTAETGEIGSTYFITPEDGSLVKPLLKSGFQYPENLKLEITVCHTWGPKKDSISPTITGEGI